MSKTFKMILMALVLVATEGCKAPLDGTTSLQSGASDGAKVTSSDFVVKLTAGEDKTRRLRVVNVKQNNRGIDSINLEVQEYELISSLSPFGESVYKPKAVKLLRLLCTDLGGKKVNRLTIQKGTIFVSVESEYSVSSCGRLAAQFKQIKQASTPVDILIAPSADKLVVTNETR
jgi:hypothetical protein